ncbi:MAG: pyridoxamine 5'-phosphate oxidase family protein [Burkholderiaceae bacterium]
MKIEKQDSPERQRLAELVEPARVAMLTTLDGQGQLTSKPMSPIELDAQGCIWFFTDIQSTTLAQLERLNLSFCNVERGDYVSVVGRGELLADRERAKALWTPMARPWFPDGPESPQLRLLKIVPHSVEYWDSPNSKMVRLFAIAASVAAAKPVGLGEHGNLDVARR